MPQATLRCVTLLCVLTLHLASGIPLWAQVHAPLTQADTSACIVPRPEQADALDDLLARAGLDRSTLGWSDSDFTIFSSAMAADIFRLPDYNRIHRHPLNMPGFVRTLVAELDAGKARGAPVSQAIVAAAARLGFPIDQPSVPDGAPEADPTPLAHALQTVIRDTGGVPNTAELLRQTANIPDGLQRAMVPVLYAVVEAVYAVDHAYAAVSPAVRQALRTTPSLFLPRLGARPNVTQASIRAALNGGFRYAEVYQAAANLAAAIEQADLRRFVGTWGFRLNIMTPVGRVVIQDTDDHTYDPSDPDFAGNLLLVLDTGGDDTYRIGAGGATPDQPVSVLIDLGGRDSYGYRVVPDPHDGNRLPSDSAGRYTPSGPPSRDYGPFSLSTTPRQGAGISGIGMLFDLGMTGDEYRSLRLSQGFGVLGVGVLYDAGGDDRYYAEAGAQGAGAFGMGLLIDAGGSDEYRIYHAGQVFGYVRGFGALYDANGNDLYWADVGDPARGGDPLYISAQRPGRSNLSLTQGVGFGRRNDTDRVYMSGGLGLLRDGSGNDRYVTSVFGQGAGYWFGTGILYDSTGADQYDGLWYVQGAAAHFALGAFWDLSGNDRYNQRYAPVATAIGVGHDFSVGWHFDGGGSDRYRAPHGLALGAGQANGIGLFINLGGNDLYRAGSGIILGTGRHGAEVRESAQRWRLLSFGLFLDVGGTDTFEVDGTVQLRNSTIWPNEPDPQPGRLGRSPAERGGGGDVAQGTVVLPDHCP